MSYETTNWEEELSEEAKNLYKQLKPQYDKKLSEIKKIPVSVLIWGPSTESTSEIGKIRKQLRSILRQEGNLAMFSEELCDINCDFSVRIQQLVQAEQYDIVISIPESPGSIGEIHDFAVDTRVNKKFIIFLNEDFSSGYSFNSLISISSAVSAEIILYSNNTLESIITNSLNIVNKMREYIYLTQGRY